MVFVCRIRIAVAGPSLALAVLGAAGPSAYAAADQPPRAAASHSRPAPPTGAGLAGSRAGVGRPHPGRDADEPELPGAGRFTGREAFPGHRPHSPPGLADAPRLPVAPAHTPAAVPPPSQAAAPARPTPHGTAPSGGVPGGGGTSTVERAAEPAVRAPSGRVLRVLPLGTGLALLGMGIGVIGVRLRRR